MKKALLDENLPVKLKYRLQDVCEIYTVNDKGWNPLENGDLLNAMQKDGFDYLITSDKNLQYQPKPGQLFNGLYCFRCH